ncbi:DUF4147 domain-containing protein [Mesorhizobium sp.]|uniref:DUF4147 domain-containing protein n=1 Tax=Mesorhizobium sp. TaxID=1871066 RepID=UPI003458E536
MAPASALTDLRKEAIDLFRTDVAAAQPGPAVVTTPERHSNRLQKAERVAIIAFGKAACAMIRATLLSIGGKLHKAEAVTNAVPMMAWPLSRQSPNPRCVKLVDCTGRKNTFML